MDDKEWDALEIPCDENGDFVNGFIDLSKLPIVHNIPRMCEYAKKQGKKVNELTEEELKQFEVRRK